MGDYNWFSPSMKSCIISISNSYAEYLVITLQLDFVKPATYWIIVERLRISVRCGWWMLFDILFPFETSEKGMYGLQPVLRDFYQIQIRFKNFNFSFILRLLHI